MRSFLILNTPWRGTGNRSPWTFSGADDGALRECLDQLAGWVALDPDDRWTAALVFGFSGSASHERQRAWTLDGALALAELLPDSLDDLRDELLESFAARKAGWLGDARTPPAGETLA